MIDSELINERLVAFMVGLERRNPAEPEFIQAVAEVAASVIPIVMSTPAYEQSSVLERLTEPDRIIIFRVAWQDDAGNVRVNRAWRVQFSNAIGPYKGGLRFHPTVTQSVLKFLGFEQMFKNALTGLPMGGAKGGSNFNPKGKSDGEVMRFCQSLMTELHRYVGEDTDVPAGDIGVGAREVSFLFGQYKRLENRFTGVLTGKGLTFGGSHIRTEATGYGAVYFAREILDQHDDSLADKRVAVSGSGNVAIYAAEKARELGATVITLSDSGGTVHDPAGIDEKKLAFVKDLKEVRRGRIREYADRFGVSYLEGQRPWSVPCEVALPCATQNELDVDDARALIDNGCRLVVEGANMPTSLDGIAAFQGAGVLFAPAKAANAGGVAVSGLEQSQNSQRLVWEPERVDDELQAIMRSIHAQCVEHGSGGPQIDYVRGANVAGFRRVADALVAQGIV